MLAGNWKRGSGAPRRTTGAVSNATRYRTFSFRKKISSPSSPNHAALRLDRNPYPLGFEQEITQVGNSVPAPAVDLDEFLATANVVNQGFLRVQVSAQLIEVSHLQLGASES